MSIIAVSDFADPALRKDTSVSTSIEDAAKDLSTFFESHLHVVPQLFEHRDETTSDYLRNWFFRDLAKNSRPAVYLIFVLSHGFPFQRSSTGPYTQLFIATSDTCKVKTATCTTSLIGSSLRGGEIIDAVRDMPKRSTVILFIDVCGAGALDTQEFQDTLRTDPKLAGRMIIVLSSLGSESTYGARFTKALTKIWSDAHPQSHCGQRQVESFLTREIQSIPGASADLSQNARLIAPLLPDFCIESFNFNNRFLFLSNGADGPVTVSLQSSKNVPLDSFTLSAGQNIPLGDLEGAAYTVIASQDRAQDKKVVDSVDLTNQPAAVDVLFSDEPIDKLTALSNAANYLQSRDLLPDVQSGLRRDVEQLIAQTRSPLEDRQATILAQLGTLEHGLNQYRGDAGVVELADAMGCHSGHWNQVNRPVCLQEQVYKEHEKAVFAKENIDAQLDRLRQVQAENERAHQEWERRQEREKEIARRLGEIYRNVQITPRGVEVELNIQKLPFWRGLFGFWQDDRLRLVSEVLKQSSYANLEIEVTGYGSNFGRQQSEALSRANSIRDTLLRYGAPGERIAARGLVTQHLEEVEERIVFTVDQTTGRV